MDGRISEMGMEVYFNDFVIVSWMPPLLVLEGGKKKKKEGTQGQKKRTQ